MLAFKVSQAVLGVMDTGLLISGIVPETLTWYWCFTKLLPEGEVNGSVGQ